MFYFEVLVKLLVVNEFEIKSFVVGYQLKIIQYL